MPELDDIALLRQYAEGNSETAFASLVERHVNLVYSTALRRAGSAAAAEEITQAVFILLAKKAKSLPGKIVLSGWLYHTTQLTALNFLRGEIRRQRREQEAHMQSILNEPPADETWTQIAPLLEDAMAKLGQRDRDALVLRFFENKNLREVGVAIGANEDAAKMRVNRALEKLRKILGKHGVRSTTALIAGAVATHSVNTAPLGLAKTISAVAIAKEAVAASGSTITLVKGVLKVMAWTKAKAVVLAGVGVVFAVGTVTVAVKSLSPSADTKAIDDSWRVQYLDFQVLDKAQPQVRILPSKFPPGGYGSSDQGNGLASMGIGASAQEIVLTAYRESPYRAVFPDGMPTGNYDFIAKLPRGAKNQEVFGALQEELKKEFGLTAHLETRVTNVLVLTAQNRERPGIKTPVRPNGASGSANRGEIRLANQTVQAMANYLEGIFEQPVVDHTGLTGNYDMTLKWNETDRKNHNLEGLKNALSEQFGMELGKAQEPIEMLVVDKAN